MTLPDVVHPGTLAQTRAAAIERQLAVERGMVRSMIRGVLVALPVTLAVFVGITALAMSDKQPWYVWIGMSVGLGTLGSILMGLLIGATVKGHLLDVVDQDHHVSGA